MDWSIPGFPVLHYLLESAQTHPLFGYMNTAANKPWCTSISLSLCFQFFWVYIQKLNCWTYGSCLIFGRTALLFSTAAALVYIPASNTWAGAVKARILTTRPPGNSQTSLKLIFISQWHIKITCRAWKLSVHSWLWFSREKKLLNSYRIYYIGASLIALLVKNPPTMRETWVWSLGWEDPLKKGKATHSVSWPGEFHGLFSPWGCKASDMTEQLSPSY